MALAELESLAREGWRKICWAIAYNCIYMNQIESVSLYSRSFHEINLHVLVQLEKKQKKQQRRERRGCHRHGRRCHGHQISLQAEQLGGGGGKRVSEKVLPFKRWSNSSSRPRIITSNIRNIGHQRDAQPCQVRFIHQHARPTSVNIASLVSAQAMMAQAETPARNTPSTL